MATDRQSHGKEIILSVRFTRGEHELITEKARAAGYPLSVYVARCALGKRIDRANFDALDFAILQASRLTYALENLQRSADASETVSRAELAGLAAVARTILDRVAPP